MPNLSINNLKSFLMEHPPVMGNKFEIKIMHDRPTAIELSCTNVNLPGRTFSTNPHTGIPGPDIKYPYQVAYEDAVISFMTTDNLTQRRYFEDWMDNITPKPQFTKFVQTNRQDCRLTQELQRKCDSEEIILRIITILNNSTV